MNIRKAVVLFAAVGLLLMTSGCKGDEAVHTSAGANGTEAGQEETKQEDTQGSEPETDTKQEDTQGSESEIDTKQEDTQGSEPETDTKQEDTQESESEETERGQTEGEIELTGAAKTEEIMVEEPLKSQLVAELLEENELDTSVIDNTRTTKGCTFTLPEGFEESQDVEGMYVTGRYPIDASSIYYAQLEKDLGMQLMTEESFKEQTQENFKEVYGEEVEVMIDSFEQLKIQGYPAFRIQCHYQVGDVKITQLAYAVNADKSYVITYSQTNDYDRMEEYEASAQTIQVEY